MLLEVVAPSAPLALSNTHLFIIIKESGRVVIFMMDDVVPSMLNVDGSIGCVPRTASPAASSVASSSSRLVSAKVSVGKPTRSARHDALVQRCVARVKDSRSVLIAARRRGAGGAALELIVADEILGHALLSAPSGGYEGERYDDEYVLTDDERIELLIELERVMAEEEVAARWEEIAEVEEAQFQSTVSRFDSGNDDMGST